jgi:AraC family transcriptional regulator of adaptative response/methylated-DNA-[protein]-cysteine methyltransferase
MPSDRWQAVLARDRSADGQFVYAVKTTGIYCRPACPSRRPHRRNVLFFDSPSEARRAGFRSCQRCAPDEPPVDPWTGKIQRACAYLAAAEGHLPLAALASRVGGSPYHLQRKFKALVGVTPREFLAARRLGKLKRGLRGGDGVTAALANAGYSSSSRFYEQHARRLGMRAAIYQKGGAGMHIEYTIVDSARGRVLVAGTSDGLCAVAMGDEDAALEQELVREYPRATLTRRTTGLNGWAREIVRRMTGAAPRVALPLDVQATMFQWRVWDALIKIPRGETRTYREVAVAIGQPSASRAVARACATNRVAVAIPCHRVVPQAGGVGGYRWGASRKQALVDAEARKHE